VLNGALVLLGRLPASERPEVLSLARPVLLLRVQPVLPGLQLANHFRPSASEHSLEVRGSKPHAAACIRTLAPPGAGQVEQSAPSRTSRPLAHDAWLGTGPALVRPHEEERHLAMDEETPPLRGPRVLVLVVAGGAEGDAAEIAHGVEARAAARAIGSVERDR